MEFLPTSNSSLPDTQFNEWLFEVIQPYLKGRILEMGSTLNTISAILVQKGRSVHLSNPDKPTRDLLRATYQGVEALRRVYAINFHRSDFEQVYPATEVRFFDTVLAVNEPINETIIQNAKHVLRERGRLVALTPAYITMHAGFEVNLEILRKYNQQSIQRLMNGNLEILKIQYLNESSLSAIVIVRKNIVI